jgi:hypothetical protein
MLDRHTSIAGVKKVDDAELKHDGSVCGAGPARTGNWGEVRPCLLRVQVCVRKEGARTQHLSKTARHNVIMCRLEADLIGPECIRSSVIGCKKHEG